VRPFRGESGVQASVVRSDDQPHWIGTRGPSMSPSCKSTYCSMPWGIAWLNEIDRVAPTETPVAPPVGERLSNSAPVRGPVIIIEPISWLGPHPVPRTAAATIRNAPSFIVLSLPLRPPPFRTGARGRQVLHELLRRKASGQEEAVCVPAPDTRTVSEGRPRAPR